MLAALAVLIMGMVAAPAFARDRLSLDGQWRFSRQDMEDAHTDGFEARGWSQVQVPHTYNADDGEAGGAYYRGPAWYRREFDVATLRSDQRRFLQFGGVALAAQVWVNGRPAGRHEGGYAGFRLDVTHLLRPGRNAVAVKVDNSRLINVAPLAGDFTIFGGVYRPVDLIATANLHIDMLDYGGPGVYARTRRVSDAQAAIAVRTRVRNDRVTPARGWLRTRIRDASGRQVAERVSPVVLRPGHVGEIAQELSIVRPRLWRGREDPYLYQVSSEVLAARQGEALDAVTVPLGVRTFRVDQDRGLILNGRPYRLYGANVSHPGRPGRGLVVSDGEVDEEVALMSEMGATGLRLTHLQHPPRMYAAADRAGLVLSTEVPLVNEISESQAFSDNAVDQLRELIRQNYNHPSVLFWGLGNELRSSSPAANAVLARLQTVAKAEDPDRLTAYAHCCGSDDDALTRHADLIGFNRYFGWYGSEFAQIATWLDGYRRAHPGRGFAVSEYGAGASIWQQQDPPQRPEPVGQWHPEQYQALFHEAFWPAMRDRPYLWSAFVWVGFDLASDMRNEGDRAGVNDKGLVSYDRKTRKQAYFWYQANWSAKPMIHITSRRLALRRTPTIEVKVYSNQPNAALSVNGNDLGARDVVGSIARWPDIALKPGPNRIRVTAGLGEAAVQDEVIWTYEPTPQARADG